MTTETKHMPSEREVAPVFKFLLGEGPLEGCWFGEPIPQSAPARHIYWWRKYLREALTAASQSRAPDQSDAWLWQMLMFDDEHNVKLGSLLPRIWKRAKAAEAALAEARKVIGAAQGHLLNALIDLRTSTPKKTTIGTIQGGIKITRDWHTRNPESSNAK